MSNEIVEKLKNVAIFASIKDDETSLNLIASLLERRSYTQSKAIISEGDEGDEMFILYKGSVDVCKNTLAKELYTVTRLSAENHAFFGELALIDNDRRSASIIAATDCELLVMRKDKFLEMGNKDTRVGLWITRNISHILGQRLRRANQDLVTLYEALVSQIEEHT